MAIGSTRAARCVVDHLLCLLTALGAACLAMLAQSTDCLSYSGSLKPVCMATTPPRMFSNPVAWNPASWIMPANVSCAGGGAWRGRTSERAAVVGGMLRNEGVWRAAGCTAGLVAHCRGKAVLPACCPIRCSSTPCSRHTGSANNRAVPTTDAAPAAALLRSGVRATSCQQPSAFYPSCMISRAPHPSTHWAATLKHADGVLLPRQAGWAGAVPLQAAVRSSGSAAGQRGAARACLGESSLPLLLVAGVRAHLLLELPDALPPGTTGSCGRRPLGGHGQDAPSGRHQARVRAGTA